MDRRDRVEQGDQPGDVVAIASGQQTCEPCAVSAGDQIGVSSLPGRDLPAKDACGSPLGALTCEESVTRRARSSREAGVELGRQGFVQPRPDTGLVPVPQTLSGRLATGRPSGPIHLIALAVAKPVGACTSGDG